MKWRKWIIWSAGICIVLAFIIYLVVPDDKDPTALLDTVNIERVRRTGLPEENSGDTVLILGTENTNIGWIASKKVAGKHVNVIGGWSGKFGSKIKGQIIVTTDSQIRYVGVEIVFASLWTQNEILTQVLATDGFFPTEEHPTSTFTSTSIEPIGSRSVKLAGATHWITGDFQLNGILRSISFPAIILKDEQSITCHSSFALERRVFNVVLTNPPAGFLFKDKAIGKKVAIVLDITIPLTLDSVESEPALTGSFTPDNNDSSVNQDVEPLKSIPLPAGFSETIPFSQIDFEMVLVPEDQDQNIAPFYMGRYEVTWDEFMPWALQGDIDSEIKKGENRAMKLRPSQPWGQVTRGYGEDRFPALSMTRLAAELYCKWLSQQTGRSYRLPTEAEWEHAYLCGGNSLDSSMTETRAQAIAIYFNNSFNEDLLDDATRAVGSKEPNSLGLYDMAGNVCEWIMTPGQERIARGGHFLSKCDELGRGRHIEDIDNWNMNYPNEPKSIWWYVDARWVGFRVVCNAEMAEIN